MSEILQDIYGFEEGIQCPSTGIPVIIGVDEQGVTVAYIEDAYDEDSDQAAITKKWCGRFQGYDVLGMALDTRDDQGLTVMWAIYEDHKRDMGVGK